MLLPSKAQIIVFWGPDFTDLYNDAYRSVFGAKHPDALGRPGSFLDLVADQLAIALTNARAYEAERQRAEPLAELDRAKTTFFSNVSHEFGTQLALLVGPLEDALAEAASLPTGRRERLETAHRNGLRLRRLVNTLLDFACIEAGRIDASDEPTTSRR